MSSTVRNTIWFVAITLLASPAVANAAPPQCEAGSLYNVPVAMRLNAKGQRVESLAIKAIAEIVSKSAPTETAGWLVWDQYGQPYFSQAKSKSGTKLASLMKQMASSEHVDLLREPISPFRDVNPIAKLPQGYELNPCPPSK
jgi:hypothetical protein